jgi:hypothetical protein
VDAARQQLSIGLLGVLLGGTLGAILGVAVGSTSNSTATQTQIETVVRKQNLRPTTQTIKLPTTTAPTTPLTNTVPVDTVPAIVAPDVSGTLTTTTTPSFSVPATTPTGGGVDENDVQPPDPASPPATFCNTHVCGPSYAKGDGPAVQCADGVWTRQGGEAVTCSADGGLGKASGGA